MRKNCADAVKVGVASPALRFVDVPSRLLDHAMASHVMMLSTSCGASVATMIANKTFRLRALRYKGRQFGAMSHIDVFDALVPDVTSPLILYIV